MINLLYCFDSNYNLQAFSSIISILDKTSIKINLYIIHKSEESNSFLPKSIKEHNNLNLCEVYKFDNRISNFPNLENVHVSEATYYRIFLDEYLPENLENIIYIDSDIICNRDPGPIFSNYIKKLNKSEYLLGAKTEWSKDSSNTEYFKKLQMKSTNYLNAGVLIINLTRWKIDETREKLLTTLENPEFEFESWDQDLFNIFFDGDYIELDSSLNWNVDLYKEYLTGEEISFQDSVLVHFYGKTKPWVGRGLFTKSSDIYHREYRKISSNIYHIEHRWIPHSIQFLIKSLFNRKFFIIKYKFRFIYDFIKTMLRKKNI